MYLYKYNKKEKYTLSSFLSVLLGSRKVPSKTHTHPKQVRACLWGTSLAKHIYAEVLYIDVSEHFATIDTKRSIHNKLMSE